MKLKYALIGNSSSLLPALQQQLELVSATPAAASDLDGVLIAGDGESSEEEISKYFSAGLPVAVAEASAAVLAGIQQASGIITAPAPLLLYYPIPGSPGKFRVSSAGASESVGLTGGDPGPDAAPVMLKSAASGIEIPDSFFAPPAPRGPLLKSPADGEFIPNQSGMIVGGVAFAHENILLDVEASWGKPRQCDRRMNERGGTQVIKGNYQGDMYCYWVDGVNEVTPRFVVILKQTFSINPADSGPSHVKTMSWEGWSKGWLMPMVWMEPTTFEVTGAESATLDRFSPQGNSEKGSQDFDFSYPLHMRCSDGQGGRSKSIGFSASCKGTNKFKEWRCKDLTEAARRATQWQFHQDCTWDPTIHAIGDFGNWYRGVYNPDDHDHVRDFCDQSRTLLQGTSISSWVIRCRSERGADGALEPPPITLRMLGGVKICGVTLHNRGGCTESRNHLDAWWQWWHFDRSWRLDQICRP